MGTGREAREEFDTASDALRSLLASSIPPIVLASLAPAAVLMRATRASKYTIMLLSRCAVAGTEGLLSG
jgi:hypothetical protein